MKTMSIITSVLALLGIGGCTEFKTVPAEEFETIIADMDAARKSADALELLVDEQYWPFPVYSDLLFSE